ncbi:MAG: tRNA (adenosine(37)-N6)-threonylcarbamoyltransferase complex ATPase subunit type 1 TsaE [Lacipirellulaceae bacterium]
MSARVESFDLADERATALLGALLAERLGPGDVVSLVGPLGAGKTRLAQAIAATLGVVEEVTSPTYVIVNEYITGRLPVYHFDFYRLRDEDELDELGCDEYFEGLGVTLVEWGDRYGQRLPPRTITVRLEPRDDGVRRLATIESPH